MVDRIEPMGQPWVPWHQRVLFTTLYVLGLTKLQAIRAWYGDRWERRRMGGPVLGDHWVACVAPGEPRYGLDCGTIEVEEPRVRQRRADK